jgi:hypothetical protein
MRVWGNTRTSIFAAVFQVVDAFSSVAFPWDKCGGSGQLGFVAFLFS